MLTSFTRIGLGIVFFGVIFGLTALMGWMAEDYDRTLRWVLSSLMAAALATVLVMTNVS